MHIDLIWFYECIDYTKNTFSKPCLGSPQFKPKSKILPRPQTNFATKVGKQCEKDSIVSELRVRARSNQIKIILIIDLDLCTHIFHFYISHGKFKLFIKLAWKKSKYECCIFPQIDKIKIYAELRNQKATGNKYPYLWQFNRSQLLVGASMSWSPISDFLVSSLPMDFPSALIQNPWSWATSLMGTETGILASLGVPTH